MLAGHTPGNRSELPALSTNESVESCNLTVLVRALSGSGSLHRRPDLFVPQLARLGDGIKSGDNGTGRVASS